MSTVKIKTEPTTTAAAAAAAAAAVDVQVKPEPSLFTADIKFESDSEDDSDIKSEEDYIKSESDSEDEDTDQAADASRTMYKFRCAHPGCGRGSNNISHLRLHQFDHRLQADINMKGKMLVLTRQSLNDRWPCPIPDCERLFRTVGTVRTHVRSHHSDTLKQQKPPSQIARNKFYYFDVDYFYVNDVRCGYHTTIGVFVCHDCRLVPECLLTHLQQKHGYSEKSIDNAIIPESAVISRSDPNTNQHTNNPHLAAAIREPNQPQHPDIVQGWICITSSCNYCCTTNASRRSHQYIKHKGEQLSTVPALVLRLFYSKERTACFLVTRLDTTTDSTSLNSSTSQHINECDYDDGDELVLSDYSDEDDIH